MSVVLFGGENGGTGKTTLATNMAAMLALAGKDVLLLDTDRQGTASFWTTVREEAGVEPKVACVQKFGKGLATQVRDLAGRYDEIVIDAGGRDSMELRYALGVSDRAYIPVQPFQFDIWTLQPMDELVEMATGINDELRAFIVLNRVSSNPAVREDEETKEFFGYDFIAKGIQPIWIKIENKGKDPYWFIPHRLDPEYYFLLRQWPLFCVHAHRLLHCVLASLERC